MFCHGKKGDWRKKKVWFDGRLTAKVFCFQACKYALRLLGPLMNSVAINEKFQKHLLEEANLFYGEFMNDLSKLIVRTPILSLCAGHILSDSITMVETAMSLLYNV